MPSKTTPKDDPKSQGKQASTNKKPAKDTGNMIPAGQPGAAQKSPSRSSKAPAKEQPAQPSRPAYIPNPGGDENNREIF